MRLLLFLFRKDLRVKVGKLQEMLNTSDAIFSFFTINSNPYITRFFTIFKHSSIIYIKEILKAKPTKQTIKPVHIVVSVTVNDLNINDTYCHALIWKLRVRYVYEQSNAGTGILPYYFIQSKIKHQRLKNIVLKFKKTCLSFTMTFFLFSSSSEDGTSSLLTMN